MSDACSCRLCPQGLRTISANTTAASVSCRQNGIGYESYDLMQRSMQGENAIGYQSFDLMQISMQGRIQQLHAFRTSGIRLPVRSIWAWVEWLARLGLSPWASLSKRAGGGLYKECPVAVEGLVSFCCACRWREYQRTQGKTTAPVPASCMEPTRNISIMGAVEKLQLNAQAQFE